LDSSTEGNHLAHNVEEMVLKHAVINALGHGGKANAKAVLGSILAEDPALKPKVRELAARTQRVVQQVNLLGPELLQSKAAELGIKVEKPSRRTTTGQTVESSKILPDLPDAFAGRVVMRLAPYPSGPLHIGNARMVILNDEYAKRYEGKLILAFDDTIGSEEKFVIPEAYEMIIKSLRWLGVKYSEVIYKSDRIPIFYEYAEKLVRMGLAYVCQCSPNELRENRKAGRACSHREQTSAQNLELWRGMLEGKFREGEATLRIKTMMNHPNPAFRDRVLFRVVDREHPRVGKRYSVWPLLEFSWAVDDHVLGMTHILRGKDLAIEDMMEDYIWEKFGWEKAHFIHYGLLNVEEAKLSKTVSRKAIESGEYFGWEDPRTWSLQSLMKRGIQPEAIRRFVISMGMSLADITVPAEILYSENRKIIDPIAMRYFGLKDPLKLNISEIPSKRFESVKVQRHPDFPSYGTREIPVNVGEIMIEKSDYQRFLGREVRLMDLFNVSLRGNREGLPSASYSGDDLVAEMPKIQWVSSPNLRVQAVMTDGSRLTFVAEPALEDAKPGEVIQLVRIGFFRVDEDGAAHKKGEGRILYFGHN
jgi:glutamyl-tRNA synthetase